MSTLPKFIRKGIYVDYSRPWGYRMHVRLIEDFKRLSSRLWTPILYLSRYATLRKNALGIMVAVTVARLFRLTLRFYRLRFRAHGTVPKTPEAILWHRLLDWRDERPSEAIALHGPDVVTRRRNERAPYSMLIKILFLAGSYISLLCCSALTRRLLTDSRALSNYPACGLCEDPA